MKLGTQLSKLFPIASQSCGLLMGLGKIMSIFWPPPGALILILKFTKNEDFFLDSAEKYSEITDKNFIFE